VRLLLDTHVFLWWVANAPMKRAVRSAVADAADVSVSVATAWEISIKRSLGRLRAPDDVDSQLARHRFALLPITLRHAAGVAELPLHHRDPFDRMLVVQAQLEGLTIVTRDPRIGLYDVETLAA
jgi:PIN domain nuclease of toxin-antitoxin system